MWHEEERDPGKGDEDKALDVFALSLTGMRKRLTRSSWAGDAEDENAKVEEIGVVEASWDEDEGDVPGDSKEDEGKFGEAFAECVEEGKRRS